MFECPYCSEKYEKKLQLYGHMGRCAYRPQESRGLAKWLRKITGAEPKRAYPEPVARNIKDLNERILSLERALHSQVSAIKELRSSQKELRLSLGSAIKELRLSQNELKSSQIEPTLSQNEPILSLEAEIAMQERILHQLHAMECTDIQDNTKRISDLEKVINNRILELKKDIEKDIKNIIYRISLLESKKRKKKGATR